MLHEKSPRERVAPKLRANDKRRGKFYEVTAFKPTFRPEGLKLHVVGGRHLGTNSERGPSDGFQNGAAFAGRNSRNRHGPKRALKAARVTVSEARCYRRFLLV